MSKSQAISFFREVANNKELAEEVNNAVGGEGTEQEKAKKIICLAKKNHFNFTENDAELARKELRVTLSDEDLSEVSGGAIGGIKSAIMAMALVFGGLGVAGTTTNVESSAIGLGDLIYGIVRGVGRLVGIGSNGRTTEEPIANTTPTEAIAEEDEIVDPYDGGANENIEENEGGNLYEEKEEGGNYSYDEGEYGDDYREKEEKVDGLHDEEDDRNDENILEDEDAEKEIQRLREEMEIMKSNLEHAKSESDMMRRALKAAMADCEMKGKEIKDLKDTLERSEKYSATEIEKLRKKNQELKAELKNGQTSDSTDKDAEIARLKNEIANKDAEIDRLKNELEEMNDIQEKDTEMLTDCRNEIDRLKSKLKQTNKQLKKELKTTKDLENKNKKLETDMRQKEDDISGLKKEIERLRAENEKLKKTTSAGTAAGQIAKKKTTSAGTASGQVANRNATQPAHGGATSGWSAPSSSPNATGTRAEVSQSIPTVSAREQVDLIIPRSVYNNGGTVDVPSLDGRASFSFQLEPKSSTRSDSFIITGFDDLLLCVKDGDVSVPMVRQSTIHSLHINVPLHIALTADSFRVVHRGTSYDLSVPTFSNPDETYMLTAPNGSYVVCYCHLDTTGPLSVYKKNENLVVNLNLDRKYAGQAFNLSEFSQQLSESIACSEFTLPQSDGVITFENQGFKKQDGTRGKVFLDIKFH